MKFLRYKISTAFPFLFRGNCWHGSDGRTDRQTGCDT